MLHSVSKEHLKSLAVVYDNIRQLYDENCQEELIDEFDIYATSELENHQKNIVGASNMSSVVYATQTIDKMFQLCEDKILDVISSAYPDETIAHSISTMFKSRRSILDEQFEKLITLSNQNKDSSRISREIKPSISTATTDTSSTSKLSARIISSNDLLLSQRTKNHSLSRPSDAPPVGIGKPYLASEKLSEMRKEKDKMRADARQAQSIREAALRRKEQVPYSKGMTRRQLNDFITEFYEAKSKADEKCKNAGISREPMAIFLEGYLTNKYGVKRMINAVSNAIVNACEMYGPTDAWIKTFDSILRGSVDEDFRHVLLQLKETVDALLRAFFKAQRPFKSEAGLDALLDEVRADKVGSAGGMNMKQWGEIVGFMYNEHDSHSIMEYMYAVIATDSLRKTVTYSEALEILMEFQLNAHTAFLVPFRQLYENVSNQPSNSSTLSRDGTFPALLRLLGLLHSSTDQDDTKVVDSFLNGHLPPLAKDITFSDAVAVLSAEIVLMHESSPR